VLPSQLEELLAFVKRRALVHGARRAAGRHSVGRAVRESDGVGACYNAVGAWRHVFEVAVKDRHLARQFNPAQEIKKPKRSTGKRRPLKAEQINELWPIVRSTGNDPELDWMLCQTILITGARREGLLNLTLGWIDREQCTVKLDEKFDKKVDQPAPDWFVHLLHEFAVARGASHPDDQVFRLLPDPDGNPGTPITSRRLDGLFQRVQSLLAWADRDQITAHTLRHHAVAMVERHAGRQVAMAFARHEPEDTTGLYGRASREEVALAVVDLHGGTHPWTTTDE
jgi:integrase